MELDRAFILELVKSALMDDDLATLCQGHFPEVNNRFTKGQTRDKKICLLVEYADKHGQVPKLLTQVHKINPRPDLFVFEKLFKDESAAEAHWASSNPACGSEGTIVKRARSRWPPFLLAG